MGSATDELRYARRPGFAGLVTEVLAPVNLVVAILLAVGAHYGHPAAAGVAWGAAASLFAGVIPYLYLLAGIHRGQFGDRHVRRREERARGILVTIVSVLAGFALLVAGHGPRGLVALVLAMLAGLAVTLAITLAWKISIHGAVAAGCSAVLAIVFGSQTLFWSVPLTAAVAWSRVKLRDHTPAQVLGGIPMGAIVAAAVFAAAR